MSILGNDDYTHVQEEFKMLYREKSNDAFYTKHFLQKVQFVHDCVILILIPYMYLGR